MPDPKRGPDRPILYPYQKEIAVAVLDSVLRKKGLTITVEIARQGGKNELSAQLEVLLMTLYITGKKTSSSARRPLSRRR